MRKIIPLFLLLFLASCSFNMTADVTPPPGMQQIPLSRPGNVADIPVSPETLPTQNLDGALPPAVATAVSTSVSTAEEKITVTAEQQHTMRITGRIINESRKNIPASTVVTLHGFDHMIEVFTQRTRILDDLSFAFDRVDYSPGWFFFASIADPNTTYRSDIFLAEDDSTAFDLPITVYDSTDNPTILTIDRLHIFLEFISPSSLRVIELYIMSNPAKKMLSAEEKGKPLVPFFLPKQATNLQFQDGYLGERYIKTENGFADTMVVPPGEEHYQVMYAYEVPFQQKLELSHALLLPVDAVVVMAPVKDRYHSVKIKGDFLKEPELRQVEGVVYLTYNGNPLPADSKLQFTIIEDETFDLTSLFSNSVTDVRIIVGVAFLGLALIGTGIWFLQVEKKRRQLVLGNALALADEAAGLENADEIMDAIITLDDLYKAGDLPEEAYQERRATLKAHLRRHIEGK